MTIAEVPRCRGAGVPGCRGAEVPGCRGAGVPGCLGAGVPRCRGARVPGCRGAEVPGCRGAGVPGCRGAGVQRCRGAGVPGCWWDMEVPRPPGAAWPGGGRLLTTPWPGLLGECTWRPLVCSPKGAGWAVALLSSYAYYPLLWSPCLKAILTL